MRQIIPWLFFIVFLAFLVGANMYLAKRFLFYFELRSARYLYMSFGALTVFMIAGIATTTNTQAAFGNMVYIAASIVMGFLLYLLLSVAVVDLLSLFIKSVPRLLGISALSLAVFVTAAGIINAQYRRISEVEIPMKGLTNGITVAHLSDIHIGHFWGPKTLQKIVDKTNAQHPDVVFITGDLFDGKIRLNSESLEPLKHLNAPVYFVEGNHDGYSGAKEVKQNLREIGVAVLENEVTHFNQIQIIGLDHMRADNGDQEIPERKNRPSIRSVLDELNLFPGKPTVLLHHSPDGIEFANQHGVDLYLAGHTHNGQLFPFNFVVGMIYKYNKGLGDYKGTRIYTSQGVGTFGPPMRVGTKSEIVLLKLKPE
ncbi:metallophosphoesterase [Draconibacterium halophilum]|uniref:Metallophosphoesterase n=1 Tax=Draconibacterium halophilum TaxID=2706887 RepID=A0A6C0R7M7_9BACT|nr:metallophosphoesterase [Draconibacterium halophilum]QIA06284.1 metallophosphoesterase [Draconibacterium halophilum]